LSDDTPHPETSRFSRRRLLTGAAILGGATAASVALPPNLRSAMAATTAPTSFSPTEIKHVVLVMQENRSFDHYFGTMPGVRGFADPTAIKLASTGESVFYQPYSANPLGYLLPFHVNTLDTGAQAIPDTDHSWQTQHEAWDTGKMDDWLPAKGPWTMAYYEKQDIPFHWALAENFTILDNYHCSVLGPTTPNRMMWMTGTIDPNGEAGGPILETVTSGKFNWPTYAEALTEAGVSWKFYNDALGNAYMNVLPYFQNFQNANPGTVLYDSGVATAATGQFEYDCLTGNLPTVTWLGAPEQYWEHPSDTPAYGAQWLSAKIDAIASNRELWESTVFILNYDENDGLFDHVVPPSPPAGTLDEFPTVVDPTSGLNAIGQPIGMGFRVPCIIVSPWTQGGFVCSDVSDHTSVLQFLEVVTGVPCNQISAWRRQTASDLTGAFTGPRYNPHPPRLPDTNGQVWLANYTTTLPLPAIPTTNQTFPVQPPGHRPHTR
jgi:phospholipase C